MISKYKKIVNPNKAGLFEGSFFFLGDEDLLWPPLIFQEKLI